MGDKVICRSHCPICQSSDFETENNIGKCKKCGHGFRVAVPAEILPRYFDAKYWDNDKNRQGILSVKPGEQWDRWVAARLRLLGSFDLISHTDPGNVRVLEFGCAEGMLLYALKERGYQVYGNDVCAVADESMRELGIEISTLPVEEFVSTWDGDGFDLIMSFHAVEHLIDPLKVMTDLSAMLRDEGKMLLHVPIDDQELTNGDHYHFFSNESCLALMEQITKDIRSDFVYYPKRADTPALAATYVGGKKIVI